MCLWQAGKQVRVMERKSGTEIDHLTHRVCDWLKKGHPPSFSVFDPVACRLHHLRCISRNINFLNELWISASTSISDNEFQTRTDPWVKERPQPLLHP